jgi:hypothetical protein
LYHSPKAVSGERVRNCAGLGSTLHDRMALRVVVRMNLLELVSQTTWGAVGPLATHNINFRAATIAAPVRVSRWNRLTY